ncbi:hypothetical protein Csa_010256, partial [Cucumis sativus]
MDFTFRNLLPLHQPQNRLGHVSFFFISHEDISKDKPLKLLNLTNPTPEKMNFMSNIGLLVAFIFEIVYFFED